MVLLRELYKLEWSVRIWKTASYIILGWLLIGDFLLSLLFTCEAPEPFLISTRLSLWSLPPTKAPLVFILPPLFQLPVVPLWSLPPAASWMASGTFWLYFVLPSVKPSLCQFAFVASALVLGSLRAGACLLCRLTSQGLAQCLHKVDLSATINWMHWALAVPLDHSYCMLCSSSPWLWLRENSLREQ